MKKEAQTLAKHDGSEITDDEELRTISEDIDGSSNGLQGQYFRWEPDSIRLMLTLRFERQSEFEEHIRQKKIIWQEIATEMLRQGGFLISGEICDLKYRNMLQTYKKNRLKEERGLESTIVWEYYEMFKNAMQSSSDPEEFVPSMVCQSMCDGSDGITKDGIVVQKRSKRKKKKSTATNTTVGSKTRPSKKRSRISPASSCTEDDDGDLSHNNDLNQLLSDVETKPDISILRTEAASAASTPIVPNTTTAAVLSVSEFKECQVFGESVGLQLANIQNSQTRSLLQLKIQELLYMAKIGRLTEN